jgi:hypothetical protein
MVMFAEFAIRSLHYADKQAYPDYVARKEWLVLCIVTFLPIQNYREIKREQNETSNYVEVLVQPIERRNSYCIMVG